MFGSLDLVGRTNEPYEKEIDRQGERGRAKKRRNREALEMSW